MSFIPLIMSLANPLDPYKHVNDMGATKKNNLGGWGFTRRFKTQAHEQLQSWGGTISRLWCKTQKQFLKDIEDI